MAVGKHSTHAVWRKGLLYKLNNIGIKGKLWMLIDDCHIYTKSAVIVNYQQSKWFHVEQGIRQGGRLIGFSIYSFH